MKDRTKETAGLLRLIAGVIFFLGMLITIILILVGVLSLVAKDNSVAMSLLKTTGALLIVYGIISGIWHTLIYALLNGFAMIVENSDRTRIENALFEIADNTRILSDAQSNPGQ